MYFEMAVQLSDRYKALDPITIRQTKAHEVYLLYGRTLLYNKRHEINTSQPKTRTNDTRVIKRKAGDDWF